jgi:hypothetical protein
VHTKGVTIFSSLTGVLVAVALIEIVLVIPELTPSANFRAQLTETGEMEYRNGTNVAFIVNLTIRLSSPASLDPARFQYTLSIPNGSILGPNGTNVSSVTDSYDPNSIPNWLVITHGNEIWGGYVGTVKNSDGSPVGLYCTSPFGSPCTPNDIFRGSNSIDSGATLTIEFPVATSPIGYVVTASYDGYSGNASVELT